MAIADKRSARREMLITALLIIAGVLLAICLFAAGLRWKSEPTTKGAFGQRSEMRAVHFQICNEEELCERRLLKNG